MEGWWMLLLGAALLTVAQSSPQSAPQSGGVKATPQSKVQDVPAVTPSSSHGNDTGSATDISGDPDCDCDYHSEGGCAISHAAPKGFACVCVQKPFWRCTGWPRGCTAAETCPGGEYSKDACHLGGGNCEGYP